MPILFKLSTASITRGIIWFVPSSLTEYETNNYENQSKQDIWYIGGSNTCFITIILSLYPDKVCDATFCVEGETIISRIAWIQIGPNTQHSGYTGQHFSKWINGWNPFQESS